MINSGKSKGPSIDAINKNLTEKVSKQIFVFVHHDPNPTFPNGIPNPYLRKIDHRRLMLLSMRGPTLVWLLTATSTGVFLLSLWRFYLLGIRVGLRWSILK